jgi:phospholipid/cholesterol/gamma-HCH transport system substrate-binding protein
MRTIEISVGAFVLAGIIALIFLAVRVSGINTSADEEGYLLQARFDDVSGLKVRAKVTIAGVAVGRVTSITVDAEYGEAIVGLAVQDAIGPLALDTGAQIVTEGVMGGRYIALTPGADEELLANGDFLTETQGALVLEKLIGDFVTSLGK